MQVHKTASGKTKITNAGIPVEKAVIKLKEQFQQEREERKAQNAKLKKAMSELIEKGISEETAKLMLRYFPERGEPEEKVIRDIIPAKVIVTDKK